MAVLHDYLCTEHGIFESMEAKCPMKFCKGELSRVFLKPVGVKSDKTKATDKNLKNLALDFGMTDIKSTKEGEHQSGYLTRNNKSSEKEFQEASAALAQREPRPGDSVIWGGGAGINMKSVMGGQFKPVRDETVGVNPKATGNLTGPKAASYLADHEGLKIGS